MRHSPEYRIQQLEEQVEVLKDLLKVALRLVACDAEATEINFLDRLGPK